MCGCGNVSLTTTQFCPSPPAVPEQRLGQRVVFPGAPPQSSVALYWDCVNPLKVNSPAAATGQSRHRTNRQTRVQGKEKRQEAVKRARAELCCIGACKEKV